MKKFRIITITGDNGEPVYKIQRRRYFLWMVYWMDCGSYEEDNLGNFIWFPYYYNTPEAAQSFIMLQFGEIDEINII